MSDLPKHAKVVIIGAGIVGNSVAFHLAKLGWKNMVMIDRLIVLSRFHGWWCMAVLSWWTDLSG